MNASFSDFDKLTKKQARRSWISLTLCRSNNTRCKYVSQSTNDSKEHRMSLVTFKMQITFAI